MGTLPIKIPGYAAVSRLAAVFELTPVSGELPMSIRFKVMQLGEAEFICYPNVGLRLAEGGADWTSGRGATVEDALESAAASLLAMVNNRGKLADEDIVWSDRFL